jgi:hypothetical protein
MAFRLRLAQGRVAQLDLAPTLAVFASRSVTSTPPRFVRDYSAHATLAVFVETHRLRTSDAERDQGVSRKPALHAIRESRIGSSPRDKMIDSISPALGPRPTLRIVYVAPLLRAPFLRSSSFRHSARPLPCLRHWFGTGPVLPRNLRHRGISRRRNSARDNFSTVSRNCAGRLRSVKVCSLRVQESQPGDREDSLDRRAMIGSDK